MCPTRSVFFRVNRKGGKRPIRSAKMSFFFQYYRHRRVRCVRSFCPYYLLYNCTERHTDEHVKTRRRVLFDSVQGGNLTFLLPPPPRPFKCR